MGIENGPGPRDSRRFVVNADSLEVFAIGFVLVLWGVLFVAKSIGWATPGPAYDSLTVLVVALVSAYVSRQSGADARADERAGTRAPIREGARQGARAGSRQGTIEGARMGASEAIEDGFESIESDLAAGRGHDDELVDRLDELLADRLDARQTPDERRSTGTRTGTEDSS